ncbi:xylitol dehydrogenase [Diplocarpon rosae]|nr:xylitol dehydrogenase [Diplocarpon rosae]
MVARHVFLISLAALLLSPLAEAATIKALTQCFAPHSCAKAECPPVTDIYGYCDSYCEWDLTGLDVLERLLRIPKLHRASDQLLNFHLARTDEIQREPIVPAAVPETTFRSHLLDAQLHDRERDVRLAHPGLHVQAPTAHDVDARLDASLGARGIDDRVRPRREVHGFQQRRGVLDGGDAGRSKGVRSREAPGELETGGLDVDADDRGCAVGSRDGAAQQPDGARAHDDDGLAGGDAGLLDDVDGYREGLEQGAFLQSDVRGELVAEFSGRGVETGEGSAVGGRRGELHERAEVVVPAETGSAAAAGGPRLKREELLLLC